VAGLSAEQRSFKPGEDRWSVEGCVEHIVVVENSVFRTMLKVLEAPPEPVEKQAEIRPKDQTVIERVPARQRRVMGPVELHPKNRWPEFEELLRQFESTRARSVQFASTTDSDLRGHCFPHPFLGDLDCYQWLLFLAMHCERHVRQLEEVKTDPGFPRGREASA
jgi:hypothetical protein